MNTVALIGTLIADPELRSDGSGAKSCSMRIALPRRARGGQREPGVVYVDVTTFGLEAIDCAERLRRGNRLGLTGRLEREEYRTPEGGRRVDHAVLVDQLDLMPASVQ
ncbi:MAG TPA: single-stranded DNA-binding protein [Thermoleophilaceae bacterium]|jgi:single-strand DNA-binding protein